MAKLNPDWLRRLQTWLLESLKPNTTRLYMIRIMSSLQVAVKRRYIDASQIDEFAMIGQTETEVDYLTMEEVRQLAGAHCGNPEVKRAFLFAVYSGLRISDIRALKWSQIADGRIRGLRLEKTEAISYLPLSEQALALLGTPGKGKVFTLPSRNAVWTGVEVWGRRAKLGKHLHFHMSRHTFATLALTYGADLYCIKELLGHRDITTTQIYAKVVSERKDQAVRVIPPLLP